MNAWIVFLAAFVAFVATVTAEKKIVCYFGSWAVYRPEAGKFNIADIDPQLCTHIIYTFIGINRDGTIKVLDPWQDLPDNYGKNGFGKFNELRKNNPKVKTMIAIGGWNEGSVKYSNVAANPTLRAKFVNSVIEFLKKYGFNGFDVDWEYPNQRGGKPADKENFVTLLKELREEFDKHGFLLSAAVGATENSSHQSYIIPEISKHLHFINLMAYDLHGSWESTTGINSPLYAKKDATGNNAKLTVDASVKYWLAQGAPPEKLILGVPFYGRSFTLKNVQQHAVGSPTTGAGIAGPYTRESGMLGYNEICTQLQNGKWNIVYDNEQRVPYAYNGNQWVGYDNVQSIKEKAEYAKANGLGGAMLWSIETDDFHGACGEKYPLLKILNNVLRDGPPLNSTTTPTETSTPTETVTPSKTTKSTSPPSKDICTREGFIRDPNDCSKFYHCRLVDGHYLVSKFQCPDGLVFDPTILSCNYQDKVQC
ncbi:acidic mammalian chitinase-like isoform X1 [Vespula squamosa]|uniref:Acidic mammalian chitinase-like isoform X1 n=1 Tax=Vespula squamosa TaxID=30214 RepID=A0ABD1ZWD9_VESSQ